jgi:Kef-type K+ transport system membrane component KefB/predicted amino acid-binding ACT domain protein
VNSIILAAGGTLDFGSIFLNLAIILVVAKLAAELSERAGIPAVLGEIVAGIIIGPSMLGWIDPTDAIRVLAEVGVIILLAEVGLEMDLKELRRVGRASMIVAVIGVAVPMSSGVLAGSVLGESLNASLFLGAALAATSVGITARVFGDLKALSSTEARIVLGAAVADDVLGLIILTVVTRVVEQGSIDLISLLSTIGLAVGFILVAGAVGLLLIPRLFTLVGAKAMSPTVIGVLAAAVTFGFSAAASGAKLAPIIGAFVAGTALARTSQHDRIARDFHALGAIFIPIFFMLIGIDTDVTKFFDGKVLLLAFILAVIAVAGKMIAAVGAIGTKTDKWLIGMGMVPRGEVGLIFASIGMSVGVFNDELYAVVLLVVLVTTVLAPPMLRWRLSSTRAQQSHGAHEEITEEPTGGWLVARDNTLILQGHPPADLSLRLSLEAALRSAEVTPDNSVYAWLNNHRQEPVAWDIESTELLLELLMRGNARSWKFLEITGMLENALPEIAAAFELRRKASTELNPIHLTNMPTVEAIRDKVGRLLYADSAVLLAAFIIDFSGIVPALSILDRLSLTPELAKDSRALVAATALLHSAAAIEPYDGSPRLLAQLADHLQTPAMVERCRMLTEAWGNLPDWGYPALLEITTKVQSLLAHPELIDGVEDSLEILQRRQALALATSDMIRNRINNASPTYVLSYEPEVLARHATLVEPATQPRDARVRVSASSNSGEWILDITTRDTEGLLARICGVLADCELEVVNADLNTWPDGAVLDTFTVRSISQPDAQRIEADLKRSLNARLPAPRALQASIAFALDNTSHPRHSIVTMTGSDQPGLLFAVATAFAQAKISVHHARIITNELNVVDRFEVSTRKGRKIEASMLEQAKALLSQQS